MRESSSKGAKWRAVYRRLYTQIVQASPGQPLGMTILEIAKAYGVNEKTVRRAVEQLKAENLIVAKPGAGIVIHPQRDQHVRDAKYLLYCYFRVGRELKENKNESMIAAATKRASELKLNLKPVALDDLESVKHLLAEGRVIGAIVSFFYRASGKTDAVKRFARKRIPLCVVDEIHAGCDSVVFDNREIGRKIARLAFSNSKIKRVLFMRRFFYGEAEFERELGIEDYIEQHKIPHSRYTWMSQAPNITIWPTRMQQFHEHGVRYDALFYHSPYFHPYYETFFADVGWRPELVITIGEGKDLRRLKVAGIEVSPDELAVKAVDTVLQRIRDPGAKPAIIPVTGAYFYG